MVLTKYEVGPTRVSWSSSTQVLSFKAKVISPPRVLLMLRVLNRLARKLLSKCMLMIRMSCPDGFQYIKQSKATKGWYSLGLGN